MTSTTSAPAPSWGLVIATIITYVCSLVVAGHGVGPVGLLLVLGWEAWAMPVILGWLGMMLLVGGKVFGNSKILSQIGAVSILVSWALILSESEPLINLISSIPFFICLLFWFKHSAILSRKA